MIKKHIVSLFLLILPFSALPSSFTKVPIISAARNISSKLKNEKTPSTLPSDNNFLFSSLMVDNPVLAKQCEDEGESLLYSSNSKPLWYHEFFQHYFSMNPTLTNSRKELMSTITGKGNLSYEQRRALKENEGAQAALDALHRDHMIATYPQKESHPAVLQYYVRTLLEKDLCGKEFPHTLKNEFQTMYKCWEDSGSNSVMRLFLSDGALRISYVRSEYAKSSYKEESVTVSPEFKTLFFQLVGEKGEVYINRKDLGKFFADQITAEELFKNRTQNATYQELHYLLSDLRSNGTTDFRKLHSLVQDDRTLLTDEDKEFIRSAARNTLESRITEQNFNNEDISALVLLTTSKYKESVTALDKTLVRLLQPDSSIPTDIRSFLFEHVKLALLPEETPGYKPVAETLGKLHEIASAGIKHYLIPLPTAETPLTVSGKPDHKRSWSDCSKTCKTDYYVTNESSPIEITLQNDGTCRVVKTVATKFTIKFIPPTAQYPENKNCLRHRSEDYSTLISYNEVAALSDGSEVLEWNLNATESQILKNLMGLETGKTQVTNSTNIQLFLEGFYHGLSGSEQTKSAKSFITDLESTDLNCGREFIYQKEGKCSNERYPSAF